MVDMEMYFEISKFVGETIIFKCQADGEQVIENSFGIM